MALSPCDPRDRAQEVRRSWRAHSCRSSAHRPAGPSRRLSLFSPGARRLRAPRPGFPRRCLAAPGACGAVSHRSCSRVWGFGRRSWEGSFCSATKTSAGVAAPPGGHKGALPLDARDLSSQTAPSASQGSREPMWLRPCAHRGREDRAPGSSGGKHLAGDREFASVCFLPPLTKN